MSEDDDSLNGANVLIFGNRQSMLELRERLMSLTLNETLILSDIMFSQRGKSFRLIIHERDNGIIVKDNSVEIFIKNNSCHNLCTKLHIICDTGVPCHEYFDVGGDSEVQTIVLSVDEYLGSSYRQEILQGLE